MPLATSLSPESDVVMQLKIFELESFMNELKCFNENIFQVIMHFALEKQNKLCLRF